MVDKKLCRFQHKSTKNDRDLKTGQIGREKVMEVLRQVNWSIKNYWDPKTGQTDRQK